MLFLLHLISKMRPKNADSAGGRAAIVLNGSPLFTGGAGSGESDIRKWILERDYLEAIIALPTDMFYNTGIATYIWVLTTDKHPSRIGKVQLIDASKNFQKMRKGLGSKRNELGRADIDDIVRLYGDFAEAPRSKIFDREGFLYRTITVERPLRLNFAATADRVAAVFGEKAVAKLTDIDKEHLRLALGGIDETRVWRDRREFQAELRRAFTTAELTLPAPVLKAILGALSEQDETADVCADAKGRPEANSTLRNTENVPWDNDIHAYFEREVRPFLADAWIDESKTKEGAEIHFTRYFYEYVPPRPLADIDADLDVVLGRIRTRLERIES